MSVDNQKHWPIFENTFVIYFIFLHAERSKRVEDKK